MNREQSPLDDSTQSFLTRRALLRRVGLAAGALAAPTIVPSSVLGANVPSNRINLAVIGCGNQTRVDVPSMLKLDDVQIVAVCDVNRGSHGYLSPKHFLGREPTRQKIDDFYAEKKGSSNYKGCDAYADFRDVLARDDVDAVLIVTPDHWHGLMVCMAAKAGKDIYCQKPLSLTVQDGQRMVKAVRKHNRVCQVGSQYRSDPKVRRLCELVRNGRIGEVRRVYSFIPTSGPGPVWKPMPIPDGFDYDMWLGPAPDAPYHVDRCLYRFRYHLAYSGGEATDTGAHVNDMAQRGLGTDDTTPIEYEDMGAVWPPKDHLYTTAMKTRCRAKYANGVELISDARDDNKVGVRFVGTEGWLEWVNWRVDASDKAVLESEIGPGEIHLERSDNHYRNFIDAVKAREDPIEPIEIGHRTATICHLNNIAMKLKRRVRWDPENEACINEPEASAMLERPYRAPWNLDV